MLQILHKYLQASSDVRFGSEMSDAITNSTIPDFDMDSSGCMEMPQDSQSLSIVFEG